MRYLPPIPLKEKYHQNIQREVENIFNTVIYEKLFAVFKKYTKIEIRNDMGSLTPLTDAVSTGIIWYEGDRYYGKFSAKTSKALKDYGAIWMRKDSSFFLPKNQVPTELRIAQAHAEMNYNDLRAALVVQLDQINVGLVNEISTIPDRYIQTIDWINHDWMKSVRGIAVPPQLTDASRNMIAAEWGQNLDKYIKNWTVDNISKLRNEVTTNAFGGRRTESLLKYIQDNHAVSQRKAVFLARQETSLLMSKFHESRNADIGVTTYQWRTSHDRRVRHDHRDLDKQIFSYSLPPVSDRRTGRRANPGEDFGCRCVAVGIIK